MALAWLLRRPNVVAIPGASSVEQLERNVAAADLELAADEDRELTGASDRYEPLGPAATARGLLAGRLRRQGGWPSPTHPTSGPSRTASTLAGWPTA